LPPSIITYFTADFPLGGATEAEKDKKYLRVY
jgi:hypothetical protein